MRKDSKSWKVLNRMFACDCAIETRRAQDDERSCSGDKPSRSLACDRGIPIAVTAGEQPPKHLQRQGGARVPGELQLVNLQAQSSRRDSVKLLELHTSSAWEAKSF